MESSASEDEKILRDREEYAQICEKEELLKKELERIEKRKQMLVERIEKRTTLPERPHQARRQALHLSLVPSGNDSHNTERPGSRAMESKDGANVRSSALLPTTHNSTPRASRLGTSSIGRQDSKKGKHYVSSSLATAYTGDSTDAGSDGTSLTGSEATNLVLKPNFSMAPNGRFGHSRTSTIPPLNNKHFSLTSPQSRMSTISACTSPTTSTGVPSNTVDARSMLTKIQRAQGFQYLLDTLLQQRSTAPLINRHTLSIMTVEWPTFLTPMSFIRLLEQSQAPHHPTCPHNLFTGDSKRAQTTSAIIPPSVEGCKACTAKANIDNSIASFLGAAYLHGYSIIDLYHMWDTAEGIDWVAFYVVKKEQSLVKAGAGVALKCIEREMKRLEMKMPSRGEKKDDNMSKWSMGSIQKNRF